MWYLRMPRSYTWRRAQVVFWIQSSKVSTRKQERLPTRSLERRSQLGMRRNRKPVQVRYPAKLLSRGPHYKKLSSPLPACNPRPTPTRFRDQITTKARKWWSVLLTSSLRASRTPATKPRWSIVKLKAMRISSLKVSSAAIVMVYSRLPPSASRKLS